MTDPKKHRDFEKEKNWDGPPIPVFEIDLPYPHMEMDVSELEKSDTLEELLVGPIKPIVTLTDAYPQERKTAYALRQLYGKLVRLYNKPKKSKVYEVQYIGPLYHMFTRADGKPVKYVSVLEAEYVYLLMNEIHSQIVRAMSWQDIADRMLIDVLRLKKLWARYQKCLIGFDIVDAKSVRVLHFERCEYVLSRIMRLAEKEDDIKSWLAVLKALEPIASMVKGETDVVDALDDEKKQVMERLRRMLSQQKERWIEEGRGMERRETSIQVVPEKKTRMMCEDESKPPEFDGIGDI